jgi:hypothetical protein
MAQNIYDAAKGDVPTKLSREESALCMALRRKFAAKRDVQTEPLKGEFVGDMARR